jgi:hypothetical protein
MSLTTIYQTLQDRDNIDEIENGGPFLCNWTNAWLGNGYYFWDTHIELAHWWGRTRYLSKKKAYVICSAKITRDYKCWDLHGEGNHRLEFINAVEELITAGLFKKEVTRVPQVIEFLKMRNFFTEKYDSIRVMGSNSVGISYKKDTQKVMWRMFFEDDLPGFYEIIPAVQICLFTKKSQTFKNYRVIYPDYYNEDYLA